MADVTTGAVTTGPSPAQPYGLMEPWSSWGSFNQISFVIQQALAKMQTATLVQVESCTNDGGLSPVGMVNILPLVNMVDSNGNAIPHTTIFNVPYLRVQGGANAVIIDPQPGDIGIALFASRDLSSVIAVKGQANPGSARQYDFSDALYLGGMLNGVPSQYVQFSASGIEIVSPTAITLKAPTINLQGNVSQIDGTITAQTDLLAGPTSISSANHTHTSEAPGTPTSPPLP